MDTQHWIDSLNYQYFILLFLYMAGVFITRHIIDDICKSIIVKNNVQYRGHSSVLPAIWPFYWGFVFVATVILVCYRLIADRK